jgi:hypothetical protein
MVRQEFCNCSEKGTYALGIATLSTGELACSNCRGLIPPSDLGAEILSQKAPVAKEPIKSENRNIKHQVKGLNLQSEVSNGIEAAKRTKSYATLFETIGKVLQALNFVGALLLIFIVFFIPSSSLMKLIYLLGVLIFWGVSYIQTALIRGLASYFQMKASDHLIRNWAE